MRFIITVHDNLFTYFICKHLIFSSLQRDKFEKDHWNEVLPNISVKLFPTIIPPFINYKCNIDKREKWQVLPVWDNWIHFQGVWFLINNDNSYIQ